MSNLCRSFEPHFQHPYSRPQNNRMISCVETVNMRTQANSDHTYFRYGHTLTPRRYFVVSQAYPDEAPVFPSPMFANWVVTCEM